MTSSTATPPLETSLNPPPFPLPSPWRDQTFTFKRVGALNFFVGPNGSGKSRFAKALVEVLKGSGHSVRLLDSDRLSAMARPALAPFTGDPLGNGYQKSQFDAFRSLSKEGSGIDAFILLEEHVDLRIRVEATLSSLFHRQIRIDWDSGNLVPRASLDRTTNASYRLDRDECHGIRELLVLLTHLYDNSTTHLVIDEPELNLHPQYQAFFMQEARRVFDRHNSVAPSKHLFLITHSPFILDIRSTADLESVVSFNLGHDVPVQVSSPSFGAPLDNTFIADLNADNKQLFFTDNPVFVEGSSDGKIVSALIQARQSSLSGANSCVIDAGGVGEVHKYLALCKSLGKEAHFVYDLDSMFRGRLRSQIHGDDAIQGFLASSGLGTSFRDYCGQLDKALAKPIESVLLKSEQGPLQPLGAYLKALGPKEDWDRASWGKARAAVMVAVTSQREDLADLVSEDTMNDIEGRWHRILEALQEQNIHVLPGGTLEAYLPSYSGNIYHPSEDAKNNALKAELELLANPMSEEDLIRRYRDLYEVVKRLPAGTAVDIWPTAKNYLADYIFAVQKLATSEPAWTDEDIHRALVARGNPLSKVFRISQLERNGEGRYSAVVVIAASVAGEEGFARITERTPPGSLDFEIETPESS